MSGKEKKKLAVCFYVGVGAWLGNLIFYMLAFLFLFLGKKLVNNQNLTT